MTKHTLKQAIRMPAKILVLTILILLPAFCLIPDSPSLSLQPYRSYQATTNEYFSSNRELYAIQTNIKSYSRYETLLKSDNLPAHVMRCEEFSFLGDFGSYFAGSVIADANRGFSYQSFELFVDVGGKKHTIQISFETHLTEDVYKEVFDIPLKPMPELESFWYNDTDREEWYSHPYMEHQFSTSSCFYHNDIIYQYGGGELFSLTWIYRDFVIKLGLVATNQVPDTYYNLPESGNEFIEKILDPDHAEEAVEMVNGAIDRSVRKNTLIRWTPVIIYVLAVLLIGGILVTLRLILRERRKKKAPPAEPEAAPDNIEKPEIKADPIPTNNETPPGLLEDILKKE